jgi:hypothetical protein
MTVLTTYVLPGSVCHPEGYQGSAPSRLPSGPLSGARLWGCGAETGDDTERGKDRGENGLVHGPG